MIQLEKAKTFAFFGNICQDMSKVRHSHNHSKGGLIDAI